MTGRTYYDYAILGGGCAGLSLAAALARRGLGDRRVVVIEPRRAYRRDRTWCFWDVADHPYGGTVSATWKRWTVARPGRSTRCGDGAYRYRQIHADHFYGAALQRIRACPNIDLRLGETVTALRDRDGGVDVEGPAPEGLRAGAVLDSRPPPRRAGLLQHFRGWRLRLPEPVLDPGCVTLMDFRVPQDRGIHFVYLLPTAPDEALVEPTVVSPHPWPAAAYEATLRAYVEARLGIRRFEILEEEAGVIPMTGALPPRRPSPRIYAIGTAGGLVKPSTGYAFLAIQRFSEAMADRLVADPLPEPPPLRPAWAAALDRIFLAVLQRRPECGPEVFCRLLERARTDAAVRFLSDTGDLRDAAEAIGAMPTGVFTRQALGRPGQWLEAWRQA